MTHAFSIQDLPLTARLSIWRTDHLHLVLIAKQADGSDVSWAGYTAVLVKPAGFPGTVALNPAAVDTPGAGEITLDIDTAAVVDDVRGPWRVEVTQAGSQTTLFGGLLTCDHQNPTRLRMQSGCGLDIDSQCKEPIVIYVPAQGIPGPQGESGVGGVDVRSGRVAAGSFSGDPLTAAVAFSSALSDANYAVTVSYDTINEHNFLGHVENRTAAGFDFVLGSQTLIGLAAVMWHVIPHA